MTQSSDYTGADHIKDRSTDAEQILDSLIGHIEATDTPDTSNTASDTGAAQPASTGSNFRETEKQTDFREIEKRAAQLATMLGGGGLSYNTGAKLHLSGALETQKEDEPEEGRNIAASIHSDDLQMDNLFERIARGDLLGEDMVDPDAPLQEEHIRRWDSDVRDERQQQLDENELLFGAGSAGEADRQDRSKARLEEKSSSANIPDLRNIEHQIEALSKTMQEPEQELEERTGSQENETSPAFFEKSDLKEVDARIASLEKQIVQLLDMVTLSDRKQPEPEQPDPDFLRVETQKAVQSAIASSDLVNSLQAEINAASEARRQQEQRMVDSLDALHDSLKDIGDRLAVLERREPSGEDSRAVAEPAPPMQNPSDVLATSSSNPAQEDGALPAERLDVAGEATRDADLPTWLEDATGDLLQEEADIRQEAADVFAPRAADKPGKSKSEEELEAKSDTAGDAEKNKTPSRVSGAFSTGSSISLTGSETGEAVTDAELPVADKFEMEVRRETNDFLLAAREAARAANERAHPVSGEDEKSDDIVVEADREESSFLAAAKEKEEAGLEHGEVSLPHRNTKNSLFSDKVEGPNSLLIFTSLILFGTSALLLYGMSRDKVNTGSVAQLNTVEQTVRSEKAERAGETPPGTRVKTGSAAQKPPVRPVSPHARGSEKRSQIAGPGENQTGTGFKVTSAAGVKNGKPEKGTADTLTDYDRLVSSRLSDMAPVPVEIATTASLQPRRDKKKTGSLFDEYVNFSGLGGQRSSHAGSKIPVASSRISDLGMEGHNGLLASASKGNAEAQYEVARRFGTGNGVQKSPAISVEWYQKSASAGYAPAIYRLATMYERGIGVSKDYKRAMELYKASANKGNIKAMHNLAVLYTGGNLGKADFKKAVEWYRKAAEYGVKDSQFNLAIIYQNGLAGAIDLESAYVWYRHAEKAGDMEARDLAKDLRAELTRAQLARLDRQIDSWRAKTPDWRANARPRHSQKVTEKKRVDAAPL